MKLYQVVYLLSEGDRAFYQRAHGYNNVRIYVNRAAAIKRAAKINGTVIECDSVWHALTDEK